MANVSKIKLGDNVYDIRDAAVPSHVKSITQNDINSWDGKQDALTAGNGIAIDNQDTIRSIGIPYGVCDSTSTATAFTVTVPGIDRLEDGVCCIVKNNKVTSAEGFTLNVNGLGAKPSYSNMATGNPVTPTSPTRDTTIFNINYAMLFIYSSTLVEGGAWICYRGYDANTNTIGYQLRHNSSTLPVPHKFYRYRLLFTSADGTQYIPANASTSTNATAKRDTTQYPINPFGEILYYSSSTAINANATPAATVLWEEYVLNLGYSFNRTGAALVLTYPAPVYLKCAPLTNGSAIIEAETPYVQALPSTNDGKIYILLGIAYSATNIELLPTHPVYYHDGTGIRTWIGKTIPSISGLATETYVDNAIAALPAPMVFLGTIGTSGTSTTVPSDPTEGDTYKIIEGGTSLTFSGITGTIKVGDTVVYKNSTVGWVLIPSGDEPSGTVTSVDMSVPTGLQVSGNPITTSGTLAISYDTGYAIPTTAKQSNWDTAYNNTHTHSNKETIDAITSQQVSNWDTAATNNHTHSNKSVLDGITANDVTNWNKLKEIIVVNSIDDNSHTHSFSDINENSLTDALVIALLENSNKNVVLYYDYLWYELQYSEGGSSYYFASFEGDASTFHVIDIQKILSDNSLIISHNWYNYLLQIDNLVRHTNPGNSVVIADAPTKLVKPTIYVEIRPISRHNPEKRLLVKGANQFINNSDYTPILLRKSVKRNGKGWHYYGQYAHYDDNIEELVSGITIENSTVIGNSYKTTSVEKCVKVLNSFDIISKLPQVRRRPQSTTWIDFDNVNEYSDIKWWIPHGKRMQKLLAIDYHGNLKVKRKFRARWGLAFIKKVDLPTSSTSRLDISKLATQIAEFKLDYSWNDGYIETTLCI